MREKIKSRKIRTIFIASIVIVIALLVCSILIARNKHTLSISKVDKDDKEITELDNKEDETILEEIIEDKGEESTTEEIKSEVSNTPKSEENKKTNNTNSNNANSNNQKNNTTDTTTTKQPNTKQEEIVNNNSNSSSNSTYTQQAQQTNTESTDLYNSITHGQWETDVSDNESLCEAKGVKIANNELNAILDRNELHEEEQKQPIINYSRCYPVIKDGVKHWYLHFFTTKGEGMDTEIKNKYNF